MALYLYQYERKDPQCRHSMERNGKHCCNGHTCTYNQSLEQHMKMCLECLPMPQVTAQERPYYQVAKAKALQDWKNGNPTAGISAHPTPEGFDTWFNQQTTPAAFTMMRMASTPDGMQRLTDIRAQMSQTPEGRKVLQGLVTHAKNAQTAGWFTPPSTDDSAPAPAPQQAPAQQQTPAFDAMGVLP